MTSSYFPIIKTQTRKSIEEKRGVVVTEIMNNLWRLGV